MNACNANTVAQKSSFQQIAAALLKGVEDTAHARYPCEVEDEKYEITSAQRKKCRVEGTPCSSFCKSTALCIGHCARLCPLRGTTSATEVDTRQYRKRLVSGQAKAGSLQRTLRAAFAENPGSAAFAENSDSVCTTSAKAGMRQDRSNSPTLRLKEKKIRRADEHTTYVQSENSTCNWDLEMYANDRTFQFDLIKFD